MQYLHIQSEKVPVLGYGTWQLGGEDCVRGVKAALDTGYRHIDTAQIYKNEEFVGKALKEHKTERQDIFLTTKIWMDNFGKDRFMASLDESLKKLKTEYVDMLLLHWPSEEHDFDKTLDLLVEAKKSGKARLIGVSNYTVALMDRAQQKTGNVLATNQVEFHPFIPQGPVLEWVRRHKMFLTAYSPLGRGEVLDNVIIKKLADKYRKNAGQIVLRWAIQQEGVVAIPKAASQKHIESNIDIFDFELTTQETDAISALAHEGGRIVNPDFAPDWDTAKAA